MSEKTEDKKVVGLGEKLGFMTFSTSTNIVFNFKNLYYLIFLTNVLKIPVGTAGIMLTLGTIWDAINDPLIALYTANHKFKSGEKVRPFALYCCIPWAITIVLLFTSFKTTQTMTIAIGLLVYFIFEALYTFLCMPYNSLGALASKNDEDRKSINAFRSLGGCLGSGIGSVMVPIIVKMFGGLKGANAIIGEADAPALFKTALLMGVICIVGSLVHYFTSKERVKQESDNEDKIGMLQAYKMLFGCKSWVLNMFYIITYGVSNAFIMNSINYYAAYILGSSAKATPILACYLVVAVITSILTPVIDRKIGRKKTMLLGALVLILGKIPFILAPRSLVCVIINALTVGFGGTVAFVMFNTNRNNITDILEVQNDRRIDSLVGGGDNLVSKLAEAGAISLITLLMNNAGFDESLLINQTVATQNTIISLLGWIPMVVAVVMLIIAFFIDTKKEMNKELEKKTAA